MVRTKGVHSHRAGLIAQARRSPELLPTCPVRRDHLFSPSAHQPWKQQLTTAFCPHWLGLLKVSSLSTVSAWSPRTSAPRLTPTSPPSPRGPEGHQGDRAFPIDLGTHQARAQTRRRTEDHVLSACLSLLTTSGNLKLWHLKPKFMTPACTSSWLVGLRDTCSAGAISSLPCGRSPRPLVMVVGEPVVPPT